MKMNEGILPRRSSSVWSFTAALVDRNGAHGKHREAEIDGGGIQRIDGLVEFKRQWIVGIEPPRDDDEVLGEVGVDAPVAHGVGVRQGVAGNRAAETQMVELEGLRAKTRFDVAQALAPGQLREGKTKILIEA